jgi:hypothetical protein
VIFHGYVSHNQRGIYILRFNDVFILEIANPNIG